MKDSCVGIREVRAALICLTALTAGCVATDEQQAVWKKGEIARVCPDGAIVLLYAGRLYRNYNGFPKAFAPNVPLEQTCQVPSP